MKNDIITLKLKDRETQQVVDNTLHMFWMMLKILEGSTNPEKDFLNRNLVEGAFQHWNTLYPSNPPVKARWEK